MKVLIVDDEGIARYGIRLALRNEPDVEVVGECANGRSAVEAIRNLTPDLVYLDVQMPGLDGLEVAARACVPAIIFTTAFEQYALDAFAVQAVDYLVKPWRKERFRQALERARLIIGAARTRTAGFQFAVPSSEGIRFLDSQRVETVTSADNYVAIRTDGREHLLRGTIESFEAKLKEHGFLRVHRSRLVNLAWVEGLRSLRHGEYELRLRSGHVVMSGRSYRRAVSGALLRDTCRYSSPLISH